MTFQITTILHPTDFSPQAEHAFHLACSLARDHGSRVIVLHVVGLSPVAVGDAIIHPPPEDKWEAIAQHRRGIQSPYCNVPIDYRLEEGDPVAEILRASRETKCDLIVMGTHGRTGLAHLLMGSVAEQVVRKAACPVLVVKTPFPGIP